VETIVLASIGTLMCLARKAKSKAWIVVCNERDKRPRATTEWMSQAVTTCGDVRGGGCSHVQVDVANIWAAEYVTYMCTQAKGKPPDLVACSKTVASRSLQQAQCARKFTMTVRWDSDVISGFCVLLPQQSCHVWDAANIINGITNNFLTPAFHCSVVNTSPSLWYVDRPVF
jgi:hypothetical protein